MKIIRSFMDIISKLKNVAQIIVLIALCSCNSDHRNIPVKKYSYNGTVTAGNTSGSGQTKVTNQLDYSLPTGKQWENVRKAILQSALPDGVAYNDADIARVLANATYKFSFQCEDGRSESERDSGLVMGNKWISTGQLLDVKPYDENILCYQIDDSICSDGVHGTVNTRFLCLDCNTGKILTRKDFISPEFDDELLSIIKEMDDFVTSFDNEFVTVINENITQFDIEDDLENTGFVPETISENFYVSKKGITFYYCPVSTFEDREYDRHDTITTNGEEILQKLFDEGHDTSGISISFSVINDEHITSHSSSREWYYITIPWRKIPKSYRVHLH